MSAPDTHAANRGLSLAPFRGLRPTVDGESLARRLCPPYDVIDEARRDALLADDPDNAVAVILPKPDPDGYRDAARRLQTWVDEGEFAVDSDAALYVYEMREPDGHVTRGLMGAVELRDPADGVILPHENTMAGPVADRLAVMTATDADLEPIYLVYDGGAAASRIVATVHESPDHWHHVAETTTADGVTHRLWRCTDPAVHATVAADLEDRHALIADGHHRHATYRERQRLRRDVAGAGPWDRGLALLVDTSEYGPQVHPIHRVITGLTLADAVQSLPPGVQVSESGGVVDGSDAPALPEGEAFTAVLTDGRRSYTITDSGGVLSGAAARPGENASLSELDVTVLHRGLVERVWNLSDDVDTVGYAHDVDEALRAARARGGFAVLVRATPVSAVAGVAAAGARMPRKSTLFTPKPASGLVMRRLGDQTHD